jgi:alkaline phosphatase D
LLSPALSSASASAPRPTIAPELLALPRAPLDASRAPRRLALGSCNSQRAPAQPAWDAMLAREPLPDAFVWLGDIVYADKPILLKLRVPGSPSDVAEAYAAQLRDFDGYRRLVARVPVLGVWDDHDAGTNDQDRHVREDWKAQSQQLLLDFLGVDMRDERRGYEGVYSAVSLGGGELGGGGGGGGARAPLLQLVLLDNRFHRDRYETSFGPLALPRLAAARRQDMLGAEQWRFLERELARGAPGGERPADVLVIGAGLQIVSLGDPWVAESWSKLPQSRARLLALLALHNRSRVVFASGDVHFGEISRLDCAFLGYPLYDLTTSGLTHSWAGPLKRAVVGWSMLSSTRVAGAAVSEASRSWLGGPGWTNEKNFGELDLEWERREVSLRVLGVDGSTQLEQRVPFAALERGAAGAGADADVEACAHAPMDEGLTPACARLLAQCGPQPSAAESRLYVLWHLLVFGGAGALCLLLTAGPFIACACGKRLQHVGGALGANALLAAAAAAVYASLRGLS